MWWFFATVGVYLHLLTFTERCEICYSNVYWKPKCKCHNCNKVLCAGCCGSIIRSELLDYVCPYCRNRNKIYNLNVLNKEFFVNLWNRKCLTFIKEDD